VFCFVKKHHKGGKLIGGSEVHSLQRDNSLADFVRVASAPHNLAPRAVANAKSPRKKEAATAKAPERELVVSRKQEEEELAEEEVQEQALPSESSGSVGEQQQQQQQQQRGGLRFANEEEVLARVDGETWLPGLVVAGDRDEEEGPFYLVALEEEEELIQERDLRR
jgi:hypothetical protein